MPDSCNAEENYQFFMKKKNTKSVQQLKTIFQQPKTFTTQPKYCWHKVTYYKTPKTFA